MIDVHIELDFRDWTTGKSVRVRTLEEVVAEIRELAAVADQLAAGAAAEGVDYADLGRWTGDPPFTFRVEVIDHNRRLTGSHGTAVDATQLGEKLHTLADSMHDTFASPGRSDAERSAA
jgi:hypothetical protein